MAHRNSIAAGVAAVVILFSTAFNNKVLAAPIFVNGDVITYWQNSWGEAGTTAGQLLSANYAAVYAPSGVLDLGLPGSSMTFTGAQHVLAYLPASGSSGTLTGINDNPTSTTSGHSAVMYLRSASTSTSLTTESRTAHSRQCSET